MSNSPPAPPSKLSSDIVSKLDEYSPDRLRYIVRHSEALAEYKERETRRAEDDEDETAERSADLPDDVPAKATITIKEINDNCYYYWQWRDGDTIRSQYKGPVTSDE